ncbi:hypothetical protein, partial [Secundilactobacillus odoratitofui]|uniref:hypothetical protein n=1 Tax=Secundilactobacillus odoratitofui TaxID=480930 RepID=UPI002092C091
MGKRQLIKKLSDDYKGAYAIYTGATAAAIASLSDPTSLAYTTNAAAIKAISQNMNDLTKVWDYYIPLFQPLIQSYLQRSILSNPVSLAGQNDFDVQFLNDGTTFADITFTIMNGFNYGYQGAIKIGDWLGPINFPQEIFSEYVTKVYTAIRAAIERVDYVAGIDGENDYLNDYLNAANSITDNNGTFTTTNNVNTSNKLDFTTYTGTANTTLSHDGVYRMSDKYLSQIKQAALTAAVNGQQEDASQFYLSEANTGSDAIINGWNGQVKDYNDKLSPTNSLINSIYDAEYKAVTQAIYDYNNGGQMKSYQITQKALNDGTYTNELETVADGTAGQFVWQNPAATNDSKSWYTSQIGSTQDYGTVSPYTINIADYQNMFELLQNATPEKATATINYVTADGDVVSSTSIVGNVGDAKTYTVVVPTNYLIDDAAHPAGSTINLNLTAAGETIKIQVKSDTFTPTHPGQGQGLTANYLNGTVNEVLSYNLPGGTRNVTVLNTADGVGKTVTTVTTKDASGKTITVTVPNDHDLGTVNVYRTASLVKGKIVYTNWTTDASGVSTGADTLFDGYTGDPLAVLSADDKALVGTKIGKITGTTVQTGVTLTPGLQNVVPQQTLTTADNTTVTASQLYNVAVTNPSLTGDNAVDANNMYLGQDPQESFTVARNVVLSVKPEASNPKMTANPDDDDYTVTADISFGGDTPDTTLKVSVTNADNSKTFATGTVTPSLDADGNQINDANGNPVYTVKMTVPGDSVTAGETLLVVPDGGDAVMVTVPTEVNDLKITPNSEGNFTLTGKATANTEVTITLPSKVALTTTSNANGDFSMNLPAGTADDEVKPGDVITVTPKGGAAKTITVPQQFAVTSTTHDTTTDGYTVTGTAAPGATVSLTDQNGNPVTGKDGKAITGTADSAGNVTLNIPAGMFKPADTTYVTSEGTTPTKVTLPNDVTGAKITPNTGADGTNDGTYKATGLAKPNTIVTLTDKDGKAILDGDGNEVTGPSDSNGSVTVNIPAGVVTPGETVYLTDDDATPSPVVVPSDMTGVTVMHNDTDKGYDVTGTATPGTTVTLTDVNGDPILGADKQPIKVKADSKTGAFTATIPDGNVAPGAVVNVTAGTGDAAVTTQVTMPNDVIGAEITKGTD